MHGCVNQPQATDFPGGSTRRYLLHIFNELDSPLATIFVSYQVGLAETVMLRSNLFGGRRLDRKHPARFPRANLIRNVSSATLRGWQTALSDMAITKCCTVRFDYGCRRS